MRSALVICALALAACDGGETPPPVSERSVESAEKQDTPPLYKYASLKAAMDESQITLDVFWSHFRDPLPGEDVFRVKIAQESDEYLRDYVWVEYLQENGGPEDWRGVVSIENGGNDRFTTGQTLEFAADDIVDWSYADNGKFRGSYTTRAMLGLTDADISAIEAAYHDSPVPEDVE
ncbi:MAG: DUF2314 domain-containing protein [Pseudomonadota bacterium]